MTQTQTAFDVDKLFKTPAAQSQPPAFLYMKGNIFTSQDVEAIEHQGSTTWAMRKEIAQWADVPLAWNNLPSLLRSTILADAIEPLGVPLRYAIPFRHVGRVLTFAVLPADREPIRVQRSDPAAKLVATPQRPIFRDPPIPFLTLGLANRETLLLHARLVRQILQQPEEGDSQIAPTYLTDILLGIARTGETTCSEAFYYLTQLRMLVSGAWRQVRENQGMLAVEYLIRQSSDSNPLQAQLLAEAHLLDGRPIEWDESPLRVTIS